MAAERTYSAWVRTGLFSLASGAGAKGVLTGLMPTWIILADSSGADLFSVFCYLAAVWRFSNSGAVRPTPDVPRIDARILIAMSGFLSVVSAVALLGSSGWHGLPRNDCFWRILLKKSKIVGLQKSRKCRMLANSATARPCRMDKSASSRFCGDRCGPLASKRLRRTAALRIFGHQRKRTFSTQSARSGRCG